MIKIINRSTNFINELLYMHFVTGVARGVIDDYVCYDLSSLTGVLEL